MAAWDGYEEVRESRRIGTAADLRAPRLRDLAAMWRARCGPDGALPGRADFRTRDLLAMGGIITLFDVELAPFRMRVRLVGTQVTQIIGRDVTGLTLQDAYAPEVVPLFEAVYRRCIAERQPIATSGRLHHIVRSYMPFESVDMPLAGDGRTVDMIMKGSLFGDEAE